MARINPINQSTLPTSVKAAFEEHVAKYQGRITNMKATLGHSVPAFEAYMQWYPLYQQVETILGKDLACHYAYSISHGTDCPLCSTFFRKLIIDAGRNPEDLQVSESDKQLLTFGSCIAKRQGHIADHIYDPIAARFSKKDMVTLISFAGIMIATNIFNNVVETEIDEYLQDYLPAVKSIWRHA